MPCVKKVVRRLAREMPPNVIPIRERAEVRAKRAALMQIAVEYCTARCGGCPLTRQYSDAEAPTA